MAIPALKDMQPIEVKVTTLSRKIAKQIRIEFWPSKKILDGFTPVGFISRDAIENGSREFVIGVCSGDFLLIPANHIDTSNDKLPHIYLV
jgi:hypothetical protein